MGMAEGKVNWSDLQPEPDTTEVMWKKMKTSPPKGKEVSMNDECPTQKAIDRNNMQYLSATDAEFTIDGPKSGRWVITRVKDGYRVQFPQGGEFYAYSSHRQLLILLNGYLDADKKEGLRWNQWNEYGHLEHWFRSTAGDVHPVF